MQLAAINTGDNMNMKKTFVFILVLLLLSVQLLPLCTYAAPATYSDTLNSGKRDEVCVSLSGTGQSYL